MGPTLWSLVLSLVLLVTSSSMVGAQEHTRVTVFEAWFIHNESTGTPTAVEKGFFSGLDVTVIGGGPGLSPIERVMAEAKKGGIVFGVDYPYNVLEAREKQQLPLVVVAHDFQKSAVRLLSWQEIKTPRDIQGTVATWSGYDKQVKAAIGPDWEQRITMVNQQGDPATIGAWLKKDYPFAHAMLYNEILDRQAAGQRAVLDLRLQRFRHRLARERGLHHRGECHAAPPGHPGLRARPLPGLRIRPCQPR